jgi:hypothetical protein
MRIFLDAILRLLLDTGHELHADTYVVEEARRNLVAKAGGAEVALADILATVAVAAFVTGRPFDKTLPVPEKDCPVLAAAIRLKCDVLVTGDRAHFGELYGKVLHGVTIHSPRSLAEAVLSS